MWKKKDEYSKKQLEKIHDYLTKMYQEIYDKHKRRDIVIWTRSGGMRLFHELLMEESKKFTMNNIDTYKNQATELTEYEQLLFKMQMWLLKEKGYIIRIYPISGDEDNLEYAYDYSMAYYVSTEGFSHPNGGFNSYKDALESAIISMLKFIT